MSEFSKPVVVSLNGVQILYASESDFEVRSNDQSVFTLAQGLAGHSDGAAESTINVQSAIPFAGVEVDWHGLALDHVTVDMGYNIAGEEYVVRGRVMNASKRGQVNQPNGISMSFHGKVIRRPTGA